MMNPADLTLPTLSPTLPAKNLPTPQLSAQKNGKTPVPRVDPEPIYTQLKAALADHWADYKAALNAFVLGNLNQAELNWVLQPLLSNTPSVLTSADPTRSPVSTLHLHNSLVVTLFANVYRDPPPTEVAPWVVATDKPATASKTTGASGANDKTEERLKKETMSLHARDRRRIKTLKEGGVAVNDGVTEMLDYRNELAVKQTDIAPQSGGGLAKTNWDLEIRRRYAQPLASETLEFPSQSDVQNRIEPICAEEGLAGSTQASVQHCAELVEQATEVFLKEMLGQLMSHVRSNAEGCVQTSKFKQQLRKEESDAECGVVQRSAGGLLPVEMEMQASRHPLDMDDMRTSLQLSDTYLRRNHFLDETIALNRYPDLDVDYGRPVNGVSHRPTTNGSLSQTECAAAARGDPMAVNGDDYWKSGNSAAHSELMGVLDHCLAFG